MIDLETTVKQNDAYYQGAYAASMRRGRESCPFTEAMGMRLIEFWLKGYDNRVRLDNK